MLSSMIAKYLISLCCFLGTTGWSNHSADWQHSADVVCASDASGPSWQALEQADADQWALRRLAQRVSRRGGMSFSAPSCPSLESGSVLGDLCQTGIGWRPLSFLTMGHPQFMQTLLHLSHPCRVFLHQRHLF